MENKDSVYVYILTKPSFKEDWVKIGKSSRLSNLIDQSLKVAPRGSLKLSNKGYRDLQKYIKEIFEGGL